jgi:hypothetical protein
MKICSRCVLPETFPKIQFDGEGVCNYCHKEEKIVGEAPERKEKYRRKLDELIGGLKGKAPVYDAIMAYSGGKDSSYTLKLLRERYNLRILALVFDNHFVSEAAWANIKTVTDTVNVDLVTVRPPWSMMKSIFTITAREDIYPAPTLIRASAICTACIGMVKGLVLKTALEMSIPLAAFGWSPGQAPIQSAIMKTNPELTRQSQKILKTAVKDRVSSDINRYFVPDDYLVSYIDRFPYNIHPLAFFDYDEDKIKSELAFINWKPPLDTDSNSTNCLLNAYANRCHLDRHGFHPYVWEIANMVRQGVMSRMEGIEKIYVDQDQKMIDYAMARLGLR